MKKKTKKIPVKKKKKIEKREIKLQKLKINFDYQKTLRIAFVFSALLLSFSFFYYYVFFMPTIEREKLEQQKESQQLKTIQQLQQSSENKIKTEEENNNGKEESQELLLTNCLNTAKEAYSEVFEKAMESCNKKENNKEKYDCASLLLSDTQKGLEEAQNACLNIKQGNGGLNMINP